MGQAKLISFVAGFALAVVLARLPQTSGFLTGGNKFFGIQ